MRHSLRSAAAGLVSTLMVAGLIVAAPGDARAATGGFSGVSKPKISGTKAVGKQLTAKPDTKTRPKATSRTYQWLRNGAVVGDATMSTYTLTAADRGKRISVKVCYAKAGYTDKCVTSSRTKKIASGRFSGVSKPTVGGTREVGSVLAAQPDSKTSPKATSFAYQWYRNGSKISKATKATYVLATSDQGKAISVKVCHKAPGYTTKCVTSSKTRKITAARPLAWGTVRCWGSNESGSLGDGTEIDRLTAVTVKGLSGALAVAAGANGSTYALLGDGTVRAWGANGNGELGDGTTTHRTTPIRVKGLSDVIAVAAGDFAGYALLKDGTVRAWGHNGNGQLGDGTKTERLAPVTVKGLSGVTAIAAGHDFAYALLKDGTVRAWGGNNQGRLGDGTSTERLAPVTVKGLSGVTAIAASGSSGYAVLKDGTVRAWGANNGGRLGDGTVTDQPVPVTVEVLSGVTVTAIATGGLTVYALLRDGTIRAWGDNQKGSLGAGSTDDWQGLVTVKGLSGVTAIDGAGLYGSGYALLGDGTVHAWGYNGTGQLGDGTRTTRPAPVAVRGLSKVVAVAAADFSACALIGR